MDAGEQLAVKIIDAIALPFPIGANEIYTGLSVGIAVSENGQDAETILSHADVALYRAKAEGRRTYRFFDDAMHQVLGLTDERWQDLYHFTLGGPVDDPRLRTIAPYAHLGTR